jgi:hypothetical protein
MDKKAICDLQKRRKELLDLGLCCSIIGPTGPRGEGINIIDAYKTEDELLDNHPLGKTGDAYLVNSHIFIWSEKDGIWKDAGSIKGDKGDKGEAGPKGDAGEIGKSEIINIVDTKTVDAGFDARVDDNFYDNTHHLTISIPKGEKGDAGEIGPEGPIREGSTEEILFVSFAETNISGLMNIQDKYLIPQNAKYFNIAGKTDIKLTQGVYEIAFSGAIEEVDNMHGGIFYVKDDTGKVVMDLSFKLPGGVISQMHFSQNVLIKFDTDVTLQVMAGIIGDAESSKVVINDVNLLLKKLKTVIV